MSYLVFKSHSREIDRNLHLLTRILGVVTRQQVANDIVIMEYCVCTWQYNYSTCVVCGHVVVNFVFESISSRFPLPDTQVIGDLL